MPKMHVCRCRRASVGASMGLKQVTWPVAVSPSMVNWKLPIRCMVLLKNLSERGSQSLISVYELADAAGGGVVDDGVLCEDLVEAVPVAGVDGVGVLGGELLQGVVVFELDRVRLICAERWGRSGRCQRGRT